ncbi:MAG: ABC transporter permease [Planctomycetaceae bacterium]|nr:ABC transporter permease [Planctomycetaceae bacterium]
MISRPRMLAILVGREARRLRKNPSALLLLGLLTAISVLLSLSRPEPRPPMNCWVVYSEASPWTELLRQRAVDNPRIRVVSIDEVKSLSNRRVYPPHDCAIEIVEHVSNVPILPEPDQHGHVEEVPDDQKITVRFLYPGNDPNVIAPYLQWFWPATAEHFGSTAPFDATTLPITGTSRTAVLERLKQSSLTELMTEEFVATILLIVVLFVTCCHLQVSFTSQDRERGTLTALALTPASTSELLLSRYLFHLALGWTACLVIVGILRPAAISHPVLWVTIALASIGLVSVGTVMASLARTQNAAGVLSLCYMLFGGVIFYLATKFSAFGLLKDASFESYSLPLLLLSLKQNLPLEKAPGLINLATLVGAWTVAASWLFRQRGWR